MTPADQLLTVKEYAELKRVTRRTVERWIKAGLVKAERIGTHGHWRITDCGLAVKARPTSHAWDGKKETPEYRCWRHLRQRCHDPNHRDYANYGGRGIRVCDEWRASFSAFVAHVGARPSREHSIDRINNDGNYEPGNVRWATRSVQMTNTRRSL